MTEIDWSTSEVDDGDLTVAFSEPVASDWRTLFASLAQRLQRSGEPWETVDVKRDRIIVRGVEPGREDDVRHFVESIVLQANAATAGEQEAAEPADDTPPADDTASRSEQDDREMARAFRAFASDGDDD